MDLDGFYPATRYGITPFVDLSSQSERNRLGPDAVRAFFNIMERWKVSTADARCLLGGMSNGTYFALKKKQAGRDLGEDRLRRISYLIGIFKALNEIYGRELADQWMKLPNRNRIFGGVPPLEFLIRGGFPAFATVRGLLDARRVGR